MTDKQINPKANGDDELFCQTNRSNQNRTCRCRRLESRFFFCYILIISLYVYASSSS